MTFADHISTSGTAAAVVISLVTALVAGHSLLGGGHTAAAPRMTRSAPVTPRIAPSQPSAAGRPAIAPVGVLVSDVRRLVTSQLGSAARREYGTPATSMPIVQLTRMARHRTWALGTAAIPVPGGSAAPPRTTLFVAHASGGRWHVALSGTAAFGRLIESASGTLIGPGQAAALAQFSTAQAVAPQRAGAVAAGAGLGLPWGTGQSWRLVAAFSTSANGRAAPSMLAFSGGDGRVLAAGPGRLYRFCGTRGTDALIEIIHPDGTATQYYQLSAETNLPDGSAVAAGTYLGMTGTSLPCGGAVRGPGVGKGGTSHGVVAFAVIGPGGPVSLNGLQIGGWTFHEPANSPSVFAEPSAAQLLDGQPAVKLGGSIKNFGVPPAHGHPTPVPLPTLPPVPTPSPNPAPAGSPTASPTGSAGDKAGTGQ